jgi:hypothetical protein
MRQRSLYLAAVIVMSVIAAAAHAADPSGVWKSDSGSTITIPANPADFDLIFKGADGKKLLISAGWVADAVGKQFTYTYNNVAAVCTFDPNDSNKITVKGPNGVSTWTRQRFMSSTAKK